MVREYFDNLGDLKISSVEGQFITFTKASKMDFYAKSGSANISISMQIKFEFFDDF